MLRGVLTALSAAALCSNAMPRTQCRQNASAHLYANINLDEDGEAVTVALSSWESPSGLIDGLLAHENEGDRARRDAFVDQLRGEAVERGLLPQLAVPLAGRNSEVLLFSDEEFPGTVQEQVYRMHLTQSDVTGLSDRIVNAAREASIIPIFTYVMPPEAESSNFVLYRNQDPDTTLSEWINSGPFDLFSKKSIHYVIKKEMRRARVVPAAVAWLPFLEKFPAAKPVTIYEGDDVDAVVHAAVQGWGLSNVQESMLGHEAMSRMLDFDDDLDMLGAGIMSVDSGLSVPTLNLFRGMWSTFKDADKLGHEPWFPPPRPKPSVDDALAWHVYIIVRPTLDEDSQDLLVSRIRAAGLTGEIHWVSGQPDLRTTVWGPLKLLRDARTNLALTVAHVYALMVIDDERHHAWVFEDDVIFHDRFRELFPVYWSDPKITGDTEVILLGALPAPVFAQDISERDLLVGTGPRGWGTHAYIVSPNGAERMWKAFDWVVAYVKTMEGKTLVAPPELREKYGEYTSLPPLDVVADGLVHFVWSMMTDNERRRILTFQSPPSFPGVYSGFHWHTYVRGEKDLISWSSELMSQRSRDCREPPQSCRCVDAFEAYYGTGLATQSWCRPYHTDVHNNLAEWISHCPEEAPRCIALWWHLSPGRKGDLEGCSHVLIDVGSGRGDAIRALFQRDEYAGTEVAPFFDPLFGTDRARVGICAVAFEQSREHGGALNAVQRSFSRCGWRTDVFVGTAVSTTDGKAQLDTATGRLTISLGDPSESDELPNAVDTVDIAAFINERVVGRRFARLSWHMEHPPVVVIKMDAAGGESFLLPHLLRTGAICEVDVVLVEWHPTSRGPEAGTKEGVQAMFERELASRCKGERQVVLYDFNDNGREAIDAALPECELGSLK